MSGSEQASLALGMELAQWRRAAGYSQETVAAGVGVHRNTISRWEEGKLEIGVIQYLRYCETIGVSWRRPLFEVQSDHSFTLRLLEREQNMSLRGIERERDPFDTKKETQQRIQRLREVLAERLRA